MAKNYLRIRDLVIREANSNDIPEMHRVRMAVKENVLNDPTLVTEEDYRKFISSPNKGWVCMADEHLAGFAIVNLEASNVWALFVDAGYEKLGIGKLLHNTMIDWYFRHSQQTLWLSTQPGTRAENFYRKAGWNEAGPYGTKEIKFEFYPPVT
jgi:GNAT superfamily N-acetyltransferase